MGPCLGTSSLNDPPIKAKIYTSIDTWWYLDKSGHLYENIEQWSDINLLINTNQLSNLLKFVNYY